MKEEEKIINVLRSNQHTITDLVNETGICRSRVRTILAKLEGAGKVDIRKIGMAKLHYLKE